MIIEFILLYKHSQHLFYSIPLHNILYCAVTSASLSFQLLIVDRELGYNSIW